MKKPIAFNFFYVFIFFSIFSCETEDFETDQELAKYPKIENPQNYNDYVLDVKAEDIPEIVQSIEDAMVVGNLVSKNVSYKKAIIDMNTILKVKAKNTDKTNFTFPVYIINQTEGVFFNLIVSKDAKGKVSKPYIRHYLVNPTYL